MTTMETENRPRVSITMPRWILTKVDEYAAEHDLSRSTVIQMVLRKHFSPDVVSSDTPSTERSDA